MEDKNKKVDDKHAKHDKHEQKAVPLTDTPPQENPLKQPPPQENPMKQPANVHIEEIVELQKPTKEQKESVKEQKESVKEVKKGVSEKGNGKEAVPLTYTPPQENPMKQPPPQENPMKQPANVHVEEIVKLQKPTKEQKESTKVKKDDNGDNVNVDIKGNGKEAVPLTDTPPQENPLKQPPPQENPMKQPANVHAEEIVELQKPEDVEGTKSTEDKEMSLKEKLDNDVEFIKNVNSKSVKLGHNKYQLTITELNSIINELESSSSEKNIKLDKRENEVKSLLEKNNKLKKEIEELKELKTKNEKNSLESSSQKQKEIETNEMSEKKVKDLESKYDILKNEHSVLKKETDTSSSKEVDKYNEVKKKYKDTLDKYEKVSNRNEELKEKLTNVTKELDMHNENNSVKNNEIGVIKTEVDKLSKTNKDLQNELREKNDYLHDLHQMHKIDVLVSPQQMQVKENEIQRQNTQATPIPMLRSRENNVVSTRGFGVSRR